MYNVTEADFDADFALVTANGKDSLIETAGAKPVQSSVSKNLNFMDSVIKSNMNITKNSFNKDMNASKFSSGSEQFRSEGGQPAMRQSLQNFTTNLRPNEKPDKSMQSSYYKTSEVVKEEVLEEDESDFSEKNFDWSQPNQPK